MERSVMIVIILAVIAFLILVNALYVAAEFATVSARRVRVHDLAESGNPLARQLLHFLEDRQELDRYVAACQVGITLSSLVVGFYGQSQLTPYVAPLLVRLGVSELAAASVTATVLLLALTALQVILGELLPKSVALRYPERLALAVSVPMRWSLLLLRPFIRLLNGSAITFMRALGIGGDASHSHVHSPAELEMIFRESAEGGLIDGDEREMLENVFKLDTRHARQVMVPRTRMMSVSLERPAGELLPELAASPYSRFPVYGESIDDIRGVVHLQDLYLYARENPNARIESIVRQVPVVPESLPASEVWQKLRAARASMVIVFDEYGGVSGLITIEDLLEEVFGELQDEFDRERALYQREGPNSVRLRSDVLVEVVNSRFLLNLPTEPSDTVGGLVMDRLERTARVGDVVTVEGVRLEVTAVEGTAITEVLLSLPEITAEGGEDDDA